MANIFGGQAKPNDVFTPRSHDLNQKTYAEREALEARLTKALRGHKYIILCGESGNGKTWLYKRVLAKQSIHYEVVNLSKMNTEKSLNRVFSLKLGEFGDRFLDSEIKEFDIGVKPGGLGAGYKSTMEYKSMPAGEFEQLAERMYQSSGDKTSVLVLDNFEQIVDNDDFIKEIASLIISADEEFVARTKLKIMIVGTPSNIKQMISKVSNANTISNRFVEIPEVARLEPGEARYIMSQGFENHLKCTMLVDKNILYRNISHKTDRIAQHVQELCLKIAEKAHENGNTITQSVVEDAEGEWLEETLSSDLAVVEGLMNSLETKVGRKNQVMYCLGLIDKEDFRHSDVDLLVRQNFIVENEVDLNIPQILSGFSKPDNPLIRKSVRAGMYRFCSPKSKMVIRTNLYIGNHGRVYKRP